MQPRLLISNNKFYTLSNFNADLILSRITRSALSQHTTFFAAPSTTKFITKLTPWSLLQKPQKTFPTSLMMIARPLEIETPSVLLVWILLFLFVVVSVFSSCSLLGACILEPILYLSINEKSLVQKMTKRLTMGY